MTPSDILPHYLKAAGWSTPGSAADGTEYEAIEDAPGAKWTDNAKRKATKLLKIWLEQTKYVIESIKLTPEQVGHSLWLDSAGHGAGFLDYVDLKAEKGHNQSLKYLHELAKNFSVEVYLDDNNGMELDNYHLDANE